MDYRSYIKALSEGNAKKKKVDDSPLNVEVARYDIGSHIIVMKGRWKDGIIQDIKQFVEEKPKN